MLKISAPLASIIITLIVTTAISIGAGVFTFAPRNYAIITFDGGYKRLGIINEESVYTKADIEMNGDVIQSGSFDEVIAFLEEQADGSGRGLNSNLSDGVAVRATAGIKYFSSDAATFDLETETLYVKSTQVNPVNMAELANKLKAIEESVKANRVETSNDALSFEVAPKQSIFSLLDKIYARLSR
jgi:hypothetical protein